MNVFGENLQFYRKQKNLTQEQLAEQKIRNQRIGVWSGCIMIVATIVFFVAGFAFHQWKICWLAFPIGGMLCGIVALVLHGT